VLHTGVSGNLIDNVPSASVFDAAGAGASGAGSRRKTITDRGRCCTGVRSRDAVLDMLIFSRVCLELCIPWYGAAPWRRTSDLSN
jgi:hypothetical protein